jgi:preprotein translocase subunit SecB
VEQAKLQFKGFEITKIVLDRDPSVKSGNFNVDIQHIAQAQEDNKNKIKSVFIITINSEAQPLFNFQVQAIGDFEIIGEADEKIYNNFMNISAPSIVYPYIRAFISTTMLQAGIQPVIIPSINFAAMPPVKVAIEPAVKK